MVRYKVRIASPCKIERVQEEEGKDDDNASQYTPPKLLVHQGLNTLFPFKEVFHCEIQRIECPDIECGQCCRQRHDDQQDYRPSVIRGDLKTRHGIYDPKDEVGDSKNTDVDHSLAKAGLDDTVSHADD